MALDDIEILGEYLLVEELENYEHEDSAFQFQMTGYDNSLKPAKVIKSGCEGINPNEVVWYLPMQVINFYHKNQIYILLPKNAVILKERKEEGNNE
jgi:hypothetical protein